MPNFQTFLDNGYKEYTSPSYGYFDSFCQKAIKNEGKKLFFLNVYEHKEKTFPNGNIMPMSIVCKVQFYQHSEEDRGGWFSVDLHHCETWSLGYISEFFDRIYKNMNCVPDIHNND